MLEKGEWILGISSIYDMEAEELDITRNCRNVRTVLAVSRDRGSS
jgi:hypothetical protein